jgi:hypothetical protein
MIKAFDIFSPQSSHFLHVVFKMLETQESLPEKYNKTIATAAKIIVLMGVKEQSAL